MGKYITLFMGAGGDGAILGLRAASILSAPFVSKGNGELSNCRVFT